MNGEHSGSPPLGGRVMNGAFFAKNTSVGAVASPTPATSLPVLRRGDRGDIVRRLQDALLSQGLGTGPGPIISDGIFGPITEAAVKGFQQSVELNPTGVVDHATWKELVAKGYLFRYTPPTPPKETATTPSTGSASSAAPRPLWQTGLMVAGGLAAVGFVLYMLFEKNQATAGMDRLLAAKPIGGGSTKCPAKCSRAPSNSKLVDAEIVEAA